MSKITVAGVRTHVQELLDYSNNTKKRNFLGKHFFEANTGSLNLCWPLC